MGLPNTYVFKDFMLVRSGVSWRLKTRPFLVSKSIVWMDGQTFDTWHLVCSVLCTSTGIPVDSTDSNMSCRPFSHRVKYSLTIYLIFVCWCCADLLIPLFALDRHRRGKVASFIISLS